MDTATRACLLRARYVDQFFLGVVHHRHAFFDALTNDGARGNGTVSVKDFNPVVIDDTGFCSIDF